LRNAWKLVAEMLSTNEPFVRRNSSGAADIQLKIMLFPARGISLRRLDLKQISRRGTELVSGDAAGTKCSQRRVQPGPVGRHVGRPAHRRGVRLQFRSADSAREAPPQAIAFPPENWVRFARSVQFERTTGRDLRFSSILSKHELLRLVALRPVARSGRVSRAAAEIV
jgi:hypothetical protein